MADLTPRQAQIMELVCKGQTNGEIAATLGVALSTIKNTMVTVYEKLEARNRAEAVYKWGTR